MTEALDIVIPTHTGITPNGGTRVLANPATEWTQAGHRVRFSAPYWTEPPHFPIEAETVYLRGTVSAAPRPRASIDSGEITSNRTLAGMRVAPQEEVSLANAHIAAWLSAFASTRALKAYCIQADETMSVSDTRGPRGAVFQRLASWRYRLPLFRIAYPSVVARMTGAFTAEYERRNPPSNATRRTAEFC